MMWYRGPQQRSYRGRRIRSIFGFPWLLFIFIFMFGDGRHGGMFWLFPLIMIVVVALFMSMAVQRNTAANRAQQQYQPPYQPPQQYQQYQPYQQGYRSADPEVYQEREQSYTPAEQAAESMYGEYEQPKAQYPQQMPPM